MVDTDVKKLRKTDPVLAKKLLNRQRKKKQKLNARTREPTKLDVSSLLPPPEEIEEHQDMEIEYVVPSLEEQIEDLDEVALEAGLDVTESNPMLENFREIVKIFVEKQIPRDDDQIYFDDSYDNVEDMGQGEFDDDDVSRKSRKQIKLANRPTVAQLKMLCRKPDLIELWDICSPDPLTLTWFKGLRNSIMVPKHWSEKRRYLAGRKATDRIPYKLPEYVEDTKIAQIRASLIERDANKTLKQKQREKMRPKKMRMDIDYQVLHDAFFRYATKPPMTSFGNLYFEGKEMEVKMQRFIPGQVSSKLKDALGMSDESPPPWLFNMQRYGHPPSYPSLRVPGVNCPIPTGCEYGYHPGGWGKLPIDPLGQPMFGDFTNDDQRSATLLQQMGVDTDRLWGELGQNYDEESEPDEDAEVEDQTENFIAAEAPISGFSTPLVDGLQSVSGLLTVGSASVTSGLQTPQSVDIRNGVVSSSPYQVLPMQNAPSQHGAMFKSSHTYNLSNLPPVQPPGSHTPQPPRKSRSDEEFAGGDSVRAELRKHEHANMKAMAAAGHVLEEKKPKKESKFKF